MSDAELATGQRTNDEHHQVLIVQNKGHDEILRRVITDDRSVIARTQDFLAGVGYHSIGWNLPTDIGQENWWKAGLTLAVAQNNSAWAWGDWALHAELHDYGDLRRLVDCDEWKAIHAPAYSTLANDMSVCRAFVPPRRRESVSFSHHALLASFPIEKQEYYLDWVEDRNATVVGLREEIALDELEHPTDPTGHRRGKPRKSLCAKLSDRIAREERVNMEVAEELRLHLQNVPIEERRHTAEQLEQTGRRMVHEGNAYIQAAQDLWSRENEARHRRNVT